LLNNGRLNQRIEDLGAIVDSRGPREWGEFVNAEIAKWSDIAQRANVKPQ
jgi:hypothetical protein